MSKEVAFTQKWIEEAVRKFLNKTDEAIYESDMAKIKYLRIGETFDNDFMIQMSMEKPSVPFADTDGGDEWGFACMRNKVLNRYIEEKKKRGIEVYGCTELYASLDEKDIDKELKKYAWSDEAEEKWNAYKTSISEDNYYEEIEEYEEWEKWYHETCNTMAEDIRLFTEVEVLRIQGLWFDDFEIFKQFTNLYVLEVVQTKFGDMKGIDELKKLKQLCCWLD